MIRGVNLVRIIFQSLDIHVYSNAPFVVSRGAPEGCQILEFGTVANYPYFKELQKSDPSAYRKQKQHLADHLLSIIEAKHIPNLSHHIALKVVGTPTTNADFCLAPFGMPMVRHDSENMGMNRLKRILHGKPLLV